MREIKSIDELREVLEKSEKVFIDFYADWCGPCKMVEPEVKKLANEVKDVEFVKVNIDRAKELADLFKIQAIPTFVMIVGDKFGVAVGARDGKALKAWMKEIEKEAKKS